ncbi:hypothetical protein [Frigoribacterium sp. CG_9.8]|uniref:hypothetical protein n=1 Tax=Frigoribacterium sp. CG_9.8 TaxID=2787733 RepID=UPI0018C991A8|nr:hypothetical protein [Frigoribacterium sp. CG_9.8]MBG6107946.1 hypothetical protein [Frigoribacterium sp. CG_9.8]
MLLRRWSQLVAAHERGSALVAVLGVMVVGLILTTVIASTVVRAFGFSTSTRASVESQAAADAGVAAARAGLYAPGNCAAQTTPGRYSSTGSLAYIASVFFDSGSGWQTGCPTAATIRVKILSTGTAQSFAVAGATAGNNRTVEAIFNYTTPGPQPSGSAVDLFSGGTVEANSAFTLSGTTGLLTHNGNLDCNKNNAVINGNIVVNGNLTFGRSCTVNGNATVSGAASLGSGSVSGNLTASAVSPNPPGSRVGGVYTQTTSMPAPPPWADVQYSPNDWVDSRGVAFQVRTAPTADLSCTLSSGNLGGTTSPGRAVIINMLGCPGGPLVGNNTSITLTSDVAIFAQQFNFGSASSLTFGTSGSAVFRLWFITPDYSTNQLPTCNRSKPSPGAQGDFTMANGFVASTNGSGTGGVRAMLYTPCALLGNNGFTWSGQIYAGQYSSLKNNPTFTADPIGIAGYDLATGTQTTVPTNPQPGAPVSNRNIEGG